MRTDRREGAPVVRRIGLAAIFLALGLNGATVAIAGRLVYTAADLDAFIEKWNVKDGEAAYIISDYFCAFVIANPREFVQRMTERGVFDDWLHNLADLSFVDSGEDCLDRECVRRKMIDSLRLVGQLKNVEEERSRVRLLQRLGAIKVRKID